VGEPRASYAPLNPPYCVTIARHIVRRSDGTGDSPPQLDQGLADVNNAYAPMDIQFAYLPAIDYIDDDAYYSDIDTQGELDALRGLNIVANAINVYFTSTASVDGFGLCGISSFSPDAVQGIVMINDCTGTPSNPSSYPHEIGHYFDLFHTHKPVRGHSSTDQLRDRRRLFLRRPIPGSPTRWTTTASTSATTWIRTAIRTTRTRISTCRTR
jgi:hypothetical protein